MTEFRFLRKQSLLKTTVRFGFSYISDSIKLFGFAFFTEISLTIFHEFYSFNPQNSESLDPIGALSPRQRFQQNSSNEQDRKWCTEMYLFSQAVFMKPLKILLPKHKQIIMPDVAEYKGFHLLVLFLYRGFQNFQFDISSYS